MTGVLAAADIGEQQEIGRALAQSAKGTLHDSIGGEILRADFVLGRGEPKEKDRGNSQTLDVVDFAVEHLVDRQLRHPGHRSNLALYAPAVHQKDRLDQVPSVEFVFPDEAPHRLGATAPAGSDTERGSHDGRLETARDSRNRGRVERFGTAVAATS